MTVFIMQSVGNPIVWARSLAISLRRPREHTLIPPDSVNRLVAGCHFLGAEGLTHMKETGHVEPIIFVCVHSLFPFPGWRPSGFQLPGRVLEM